MDRLFYFQFSSFISPYLIQPSFLIISLNAMERIAGRTMQQRTSPTHIMGECFICEITPIGPTRPQVPIPADTPEHSSLNTIVEIGPVIADASVGGNQIIGLRQILPIWSIEGPSP